MMSQPNENQDDVFSKPVKKFSQIESDEFFSEIAATPPEYRPHLLKMIRLFRESVTLNLQVSQRHEPDAKTTAILTENFAPAPPVKKTQETRKDSSQMEEVTLYTDGACLGNPGPGGYGIVLIQGDDRQELSGGFQLTTNNRMEMMAAIVGLQTLETKSRVTLYSDSKYVIDAIEKGWAKRWKANGWKRNSKEWAMNPDLWEQLLELCSHHEVKLVWVKGHAGNVENECCDRLAVRASQQRNLPPDLGYENPAMQQISLF
jgi:ribonuclease HI